MDTGNVSNLTERYLPLLVEGSVDDVLAWFAGTRSSMIGRQAESPTQRMPVDFVPLPTLGSKIGKPWWHRLRPRMSQHEASPRRCFN